MRRPFQYLVQTYWSKSVIKNTNSIPAPLVYCVYFWKGDYQTSWIVRDSQLAETYKTGFFRPRSDLDVEILALRSNDLLESIAIPLSLKPGEQVEVFSKLEHQSTGTFEISPRVLNRDQYVANSIKNGKESKKAGDLILFGIVLAISLFYLSTFVLNRQLVFLFFVLYLASIAYVFLLLGQNVRLIFPNHYRVYYILNPVVITLIPFFYSSFLYYFLDVPGKIPRLVNMFRFVRWSSGILGIGFFISIFFLHGDVNLIDQLSAQFIVLNLVFLLIFVVYVWRIKRTEVYIFILATGFLGLGGFILIPWVKLLHINAEVVYFNFQLCVLAEIFTFAAGLANQSRKIEAEKVRLETTDEIKSRLYTNITHEFRTPLTVIMGMADNIKGHESERKLIKRNSKSLLRLINQLLDLSKLDSGTMQLDLIHGNVVDFLRYLTESFASMATEKKLELTFHSEKEQIEMDFDEIKLQHIIYNLLSNALKFTPEGGRVSIDLTVQKNALESQLCIKVSDTGIGIPEEQLPLIFDRFFQSSQQDKKKGEGTGVGLALTKELVELMDGNLTAESTLDHGSVFTIQMPIRKTASLPKLKTQPVTQPTPIDSTSTLIPEPATNIEDTDRPRILIIEDNKDIVAYLHNLLQQDYEIDAAENGKLGIERAIETIPDIIISDVMMPEADGYEVCYALKNEFLTSHIPIILLTAKAEQKDRLDGLRQGADAYLTKPFDKAELHIRLQKLHELRKTLQKRYSDPQNHPTSLDEKPSPESRFLKELRTITETHMGRPDTCIENIQKDMALSQMQLYRKLKALTGLTPSLYIRDIRLEKSIQLLQEGELNVSEIAYEVGFNTPAYFSRAFVEKYGRQPSAFLTK
ncbi:MAG: ATP-binding protein [Saprospiraceae bacterium]